ncbi:MAG: hypothetical protein ABI760_14990 [Ferruginibacter sp.]
MKLTSTILFEFINDFDLEVSELGVCFDAIINFNLPMQNFNLQSEVHMESVLSNSIDSIYLLNPLIEKYKMPTFFSDVNHQFLYLNHTGLIIAGKMPLFGAYSVSMFPKSQSCSLKTYDELRAKKLN